MRDRITPIVARIRARLEVEWAVIYAEYLERRRRGELWSYGADGLEDPLIYGAAYRQIFREGATIRIEPVRAIDVIPMKIEELPHRWAVWNMVVIGFCVGAVIGSAWIIFR